MTKLTQKIKPTIERIDNQFFYGEPVGVYLVHFSNKLLLIDLPAYSKDLKNYFLSFRKPLHAIVSHGSCGIKDGSIWQKKINLIIYMHSSDKSSEWLEIKPDFFFTRPPLISPQIKIINTPGHTPGSVCILETKTKSLFTGDTIGGKGENIYDFVDPSNTNAGDVKERLLSCKKLLSYSFDSILPFHYEMILENAKEKLNKYVTSYI